MSGREGYRNRVYKHNNLFYYEADLIFCFHRRQEETVETAQER